MSGAWRSRLLRQPWLLSPTKPFSSTTNLVPESTVFNTPTPPLDHPVHFQERYAQISRLSKPNILKKKGDWTCPKCCFMNFARNSRCFECEEDKPKKVLAEGEWECPKCNFLNYGRNTFCMRCDCKMPGPLPSNPIDSISASGYNGDYKYHTSTDCRSSEDISCSNMSSMADEIFSEIMPLRRGENRFLVSTRTTPLEMGQTNISKDLASGPVGAGKGNVDDLVNGILDKIMGPSSANSQNGDKGITSGKNPEAALPIPKDGASEASSSISNSGEGNKFQMSGDSKNLNKVNIENEDQEDKSGRWFHRMAELHKVEDLSSAVSDEDVSEILPVCKDQNKFVVSKKITSSLTSPTYRRNISPIFRVNEKGQLRFSGRPLLPKEDLDKANTNQVTSDSANDKTASKNSQEKVKPKKVVCSSTDSVATANVMDKSVSSTISSPQKYSWFQSLPKSSKMLSGRWVQRMDELPNVEDSSSSVSDEYLSEMMPVCKGENKFVVSEKKASSLTSPTYRREMVAEQASSSKYVPYVPFLHKGSISPANSADIVPTSPQVTQGYAGVDNSRINQAGAGAVKRIENDQIPSERNIIDAHQGTSSDRYASRTSHPQNSAQNLPKTDLRKDPYQFPDLARASLGEDSTAQNVAHSTNVTGDSLHPPANHNIRSGWTVKSLQGSAVKGLNTLDVSEEVKAEMWLQRISQMMKIPQR